MRPRVRLDETRARLAQWRARAQHGAGDPVPEALWGEAELMEQRRQPCRVLVRDLLKARAELRVVLLRVTERLLGGTLALLAQLIGHS